MDKEAAVVAGTIGSTGVAGIGIYLVTQDYIWAFILGAFYLAVIIVTWFVMPFHWLGGKITSMSVRQIFWYPFFPLFLTPLWVGIAAIAYEWRSEEPIIQYSAIAAGFILAVPMVLLHRHLSGTTYQKKESNQPLQRTATSRRL